MPYGYYILVRYGSAILFGTMAYQYYLEKKENPALVWGDFGNIVSTYYKNIFRKDNMEYYRRFGSNNLVYNYFAF